MTTCENVTQQQIEALRGRAAAEGDERTAYLCDRALAVLDADGTHLVVHSRDRAALVECVALIRGAEIRSAADEAARASSPRESTAPAEIAAQREIGINPTQFLIDYMIR